MSSIRAPASGVSHLLDLILRPIFDRVARQTTFINGIHFVRRMELYRDIGRLSPTTNFVTFDVTDLYTMIPRDGALEVLNQWYDYRYDYEHGPSSLRYELFRVRRQILSTNSRRSNGITIYYDFG